MSPASKLVTDIIQHLETSASQADTVRTHFVIVYSVCSVTMCVSTLLCSFFLELGLVFYSTAMK